MLTDAILGDISKPKFPSSISTPVDLETSGGFGFNDCVISVNETITTAADECTAAAVDC